MDNQNNRTKKPQNWDQNKDKDGKSKQTDPKSANDSIYNMRPTQNSQDDDTQSGSQGQKTDRTKR